MDSLMDDERYVEDAISERDAYLMDVERALCDVQGIAGTLLTIEPTWHLEPAKLYEALAELVSKAQDARYAASQADHAEGAREALQTSIARRAE